MESKVRITLTLREMKKLVELLAIAGDALSMTEEYADEDHDLVEEVSGLYYALMKDINDALDEEFTAEA